MTLLCFYPPLLRYFVVSSCRCSVASLLGRLVAWSLGRLVAWSLGRLVAWSLGRLVAWSLGRLVAWSLGRLVAWSLGRLVAWSLGRLVAWSLGRLVAWSLGRLVAWSLGRVVASLLRRVVASLLRCFVASLLCSLGRSFINLRYRLGIMCKDPGEISSGNRQVEGLQAGKHIQYWSFDNYYLIGSFERSVRIKCLETGEWSAPKPKCKRTY